MYSADRSFLFFQLFLCVVLNIQNELLLNEVSSFFFFSVYELWHEKMCKQLMPRSACPMCNLDQELLCFPHLLESHLLLGALHRTSKFANFCHDLMQNSLL